MIFFLGLVALTNQNHTIHHTYLFCSDSIAIKESSNLSLPFQLSSNNRYCYSLKQQSLTNIFIMDLCMYCAFPVRPRQEGLQCDGCSGWQHRTCHTGISQSQYRTAVQAEEPIDWSCDLCMNTTTTTTAPDFPPDVGNTTLEEESLDESGEPLFSDDASFGKCFYNIIFWVFIF